MKVRNFLIGILIIDVIVLNLLVAYGFYLLVFLKMKDSTKSYIPSGVSYVNQENSGQETICGNECQAFIQNEVANAILAESPSNTPTPASISNVTVTQAAKVKRVSYLPIPGSGSTLKTDWTDIPGSDFYLSKDDYPGLTGVYFEANIKLTNGNGAAFVRLYDKTHSIGVVGSELQTSSQTSIFMSGGPISLWSGYNHYLVQAKSLTADTSVFESGKLKIISEE